MNREVLLSCLVVGMILSEASLLGIMGKAIADPVYKGYLCHYPGSVLSLTRQLTSPQDPQYELELCRSYLRSTFVLRLEIMPPSTNNLPHCRRCDRSFRSTSALQQHVTNSASHHVCTECRKDCASARGLHDHQRLKHTYCSECSRVFRNDNDLQNHLRSSIHKPDDDSLSSSEDEDESLARVLCPLAHCQRGFRSNSALMLHLESGTCKSGADKAWVGRMAVLMDRNNIFVQTTPLTEDGLRPINVYGEISPTNDMRMLLFKHSYKGAHYECVLCHETLGNRNLFDAHLMSSGHLEMPFVQGFKCPASRRFKGCGIEYTSVSALMQHVENARGCDVKVDQFENLMEKFVEFLKPENH